MAVRKGKVLISGLGVAGPTLGWWLVRQGLAVTIVERAPQPRSGGYMIDFWGPGYEVAERMGVVDDLRAQSHPIEQLRLVRTDGRPFAILNATVMAEVVGGRFFSLLRSDLAAALHRAIRNDVEIRFGDRVRSLAPRDGGVDVAFERSGESAFDLVVGADGLHSPVRKWMFDQDCVRPSGLWVASFSTSGYAHRDPRAYVSFTSAEHQIARYQLGQDRTAFLFVFRAPHDGPALETSADQKACLRRVYAGQAWECPEILARLDEVEDLYFDEVAQVRAPCWSKGRVGLVGDAAYCPSLLAGEGASLAMAGAMVLAGELGRCSDHAEAFVRYERHLRRPIERKQRGALGMGAWFAPKTQLGLAARNVLTAAAAMPLLTRLLVGSMFADDIGLPHYGAEGSGAEPAAASPRPRTRAF
jgi:2-polyprenyl-6-methoxyphenol hydroxylase-like FAD-dependent oxidoreductase